ncbi:MAG: exonuclease domain-containing protein [Nitrospirota bacterium]
MFISLDLETTGFDPNNDKIIEFGAIKFDLNGEKERLQFLANPGTKLPDIITHITHITDEDLANAPQFSEKAEEIAAFIGDLPIVGHNIQFDTGFLRTNGIEIKNPEYDTCQLASILLPGLPSYSLEILSHQLKLEHEEKHRAIDDSIAAMELFMKLADHFSHLPTELIEKIKNLCKKTDWELKDFLLSIEPRDPRSFERENITAEFKPSPYLKKILETQDSTLIEIKPPYQDLIKELSENIDKDSYISIPDQIFKQISDSLPKNIAKIDSPSKYLSLKRLEEFEKKNHFEKYEFTTLLKLLIWKEQTETGHLSEIIFFNEEKTLIPSINIQANEDTEYFFKKALEKDKPSPAVCSHQYTIEKNPPARELIIINSEKFVQSIAFDNSHYLKLDVLLSQLRILGENETTQSLSSTSTIIFGLIGLLFEKYNDQNQYTARCEIKPDILASSTCKDLISSIANLIESSKKLVADPAKAVAEIKNEKNEIDLQNWKSSLKALQDTFLKPNLEHNFIWIEKDFSENIVIRLYPYSTKESLQKIINNAGKFTIISENIDFNDDGAFTKDLLGLDKSTPLIKTGGKREDLEIFITQDSSAERDSVEKFLESYLPERKGRTAIIFNSKQQLSTFTLKLSKHLSNLNIKTVSQMTGSLGKLREQFKQDPNNSVLFVTPNFWENFKDHDLIDSIIIHKIPFDPPSVPYITATSKNYRNPFIEFQIPRAAFTLKKMINSLPNTAKQKEVVLLDSRLVEKDYGEVITENLKNLATIKIVNLSTLAQNVKENT